MLMVAMLANYDKYDEDDFIRFLGVKLRLAKKHFMSIRGHKTDETLIYRHSKHEKNGFLLRLIVFSPMSKDAKYEVLVVTPKASKTFAGAELEQIEFDAIWFLKETLNKLDK